MSSTSSDERIALANPGRLHRRLRAELLAAIEEVLGSGQYILGPQVAAFESEVASMLSVEHAVGAASGTDALTLALAAAGVGAGDVVLTTPLSFVATATAIVRLGARPRFCDVDPVTFNIDPNQVDEQLALGVKALVPVHLFGRPAEVGRLRRRCPGAIVVEDAAQAFGASSEDGPVGAQGELAAFSFFPAKPLGAMGDAGLVTTRREDFANECRSLRSHGRQDDGRYHRLGSNSRLDELQAAVLRVLLPLDWQRRKRRQQLAETYRQELAGFSELIVPNADEAGGIEHAWSVYAVRVVRKRDELRAFLRERGIDAAVYYQRPLPFEPVLSHLGYAAGDFPVAEQLCRELLALPVAAEMSESEQARVLDAVLDFHRRS